MSCSCLKAVINLTLTINVAQLIYEADSAGILPSQIRGEILNKKSYL